MPRQELVELRLREQRLKTVRSVVVVQNPRQDVWLAGSEAGGRTANRQDSTQTRRVARLLLHGVRCYSPMMFANVTIWMWLALGLLCGAGLLLGVRQLRASPYTPAQLVLLLIAKLICRFLWRAHVPKLPIDQPGGLVLVSNHRSSVDPFFVQIAAGRVVHWMVAREYVEHRAFGWFLRTCEVIPVNRGGVDTAATKQAIRLVAAGGAIGTFPEGRINMSDQFMMPIRPGAVLIALKARAPLLPIYIEGSPYRGTPWSPFFMRARVTVRYGERIDLSDYYGRESEDGLIAELMLRCAGEIARLADRPDYTPTLAGRKWKPTDAELQADVGKLQRQHPPGQTG